MNKKKFQKNGFIIILISLGIIIGAQAQSNFGNSGSRELSFSRKEQRKQRAAYLNVGTGLSLVNLRDFATSPLIYSGKISFFSAAYIKADDARETELEIGYRKGALSSFVNGHNALSKLNRFDLQYSKLYRVGALSSKKINTKVGIMLMTTVNRRFNESFRNQASGLDAIPTLFGSIKITKDISRKEEKQKKFLFIKYMSKEKTRNLAFRTNIGIFNNSYRNGYIYGGQSQVLNAPKLFDGYEFQAFSGLRIGTSLDYTRFLKNKNALKVSYIWDAFTTGAKYDKFEMASHSLRISLMFNTNNK